MKRYLILVIVALLLSGCGASDYSNILRASISKDPSAAFKLLAKNKSIQYATNPEQFSRDIKSLDKDIFGAILSLFKNASKDWGEENVKVPNKKEYVKYMQNY